jgi:hypothetical protein
MASYLRAADIPSRPAAPEKSPASKEFQYDDTSVLKIPFDDVAAAPVPQVTAAPVNGLRGLPGGLGLGGINLGGLTGLLNQGVAASAGGLGALGSTPNLFQPVRPPPQQQPQQQHLYPQTQPMMANSSLSLDSNVLASLQRALQTVQQSEQAAAMRTTAVPINLGQQPTASATSASSVMPGFANIMGAPSLFTPNVTTATAIAPATNLSGLLGQLGQIMGASQQQQHPLQLPQFQYHQQVCALMSPLSAVPNFSLGISPSPSLSQMQPMHMQQQQPMQQYGQGQGGAWMGGIGVGVGGNQRGNFGGGGAEREICKQFNTSKGCSFGDKCRYRHERFSQRDRGPWR